MSIAAKRSLLAASGTLLTNSGGTGGGGTGGTITHGSEITLANVGYTAYYDNGLARTLQTSDLQVVNGNHFISDLVAAGGNLTKKRFTGSISVDRNNVTFTACLFDNPVSNYLNGVHASGTNFNWCTVSPDPSTPGDVGIYFQGYSTYRCYIRGSSDGLRINGGATTQNIVESYIRVKMHDNSDHNDTLQNVGGAGVVNILRCNLSVQPEGGIITGGAGGPNSVLQSADEASGAAYNLTMQDNLVDGTGCQHTIRLYDGGLSTGIVYTYTGNVHLRPGANASESDRGSANVTPSNQITWSNNTWADDNSAVLLN